MGLLKNYRDETSELWLEVSTKCEEPVAFSINCTGAIITGVTKFNSPVEINIPFSAISSFRTGQRSQTIHVATLNDSHSVSIIGYNWEDGSVGEYIAIPCHNLLPPSDPYEYYMVSTGSIRQTPPLWSQGLLVGCQDNTTVTITPSKNVLLPLTLQSSILLTVHAGESHNLVMNAGQSVYIGKPDSDLTGTQIVSSKPLTVISGHECGNVPANIQWCEHLTQQIPPTVAWGRRFMLVPFLGRKHGQYFKIVVSQDSTSINQTCNGTDTIFLPRKGNSITIYSNSTTFCYINADKPILVAQLGSGSFLDDTGDPIMVIVQPIEQYSTEAHFNVQPQTRFANSFVSIATTDPSSVLYDGVAINDTTKWTPIYDDTASNSIVGYGHHFPATSGSHSIIYTSGTVMVYGFHCHPERGYGYPAAVQVMPIGIIICVYTLHSLIHVFIESVKEVKFIYSEYSAMENSTIVLVVERPYSLEPLSVAVETVAGTAGES